MNRYLESLILATILNLAFMLYGQAQTSFSDIKLPRYPGINKLERGVNPGIATGSHSGHYIRFGEDISLLCTQYGYAEKESPERYRKDPKFRLNVFATQGSLESLKRLRKEDEVQLAIIQSDLWYYADRQANQRRPYGRSAGEKDQRIRDSWADIKNKISLVMPLFDEKIHIVVRHDAGPSVEGGKYKDLLSLFENGGARVNIGTRGSGTMVTCTLLHEIITNGRKDLDWKPSYLPDGTALSRLLDDDRDDDDEDVDAVILVGAVPYPALEKWSLELISEAAKPERKNLYVQLFGDAGGQIIQPRIELLDFGRAGSFFDADKNNFEGYHETKIEAEKYSLLRGETAGDVETRSVTACLVTFAGYSPTAGEEKHKIAWVQHILYRILSKLNRTNGLDVNFPTRGGDHWVAAAENLQKMIRDPSSRQRLYGWELHSDPILKGMLQTWRGETSSGIVRGGFIDPDRDY